MANISAIKLPSGTTYNVKDKNALPLTGGQVTGPVTFGDTVSIDEATVGDLVVNGSASFTNNIQANTISGDLTGDVTGNVVGNVSGSAGTAGAFTSAKSVTLTGDVTGSASSTGGWSIATTVKDDSHNHTASTLSGVALSTDIGKIYYGSVDSTSTSTVFTATIDGITEYKEGLTVVLKNGVVTSASGFTININGLGAKRVYTNLAASSADTTIFNVSYTMMFIYENRVSGGNWLCYRGYDSNSNDTTTGYARFSHGTYTTTTAVGRYVICLTKSPTSVVPVTAVNNSTATTKALTTDTFNPFEPIFYFTNNGSTTQTAANKALTASYLWTVYSNINLGYSFNTGSTLTTNKDVYIKAIPTDGYMAKLASTPIVQDLPISDDGFIYIKLGHANSTSNIAMAFDHPIYYYKNGEIRIWTNLTTPDWDENDSISPSYIENRTHYRTSIGYSYPITCKIYEWHAGPESITVGNVTKTYPLDAISLDSFPSKHTFSQINTTVTTTTATVTINNNTISQNLNIECEDGYALFYNDKIAIAFEEYQDSNGNYEQGIDCAFINGDGTTFNVDLSTEVQIVVNIPVVLEQFSYTTLDNNYLNGKLIVEGTGYGSEIFNEYTYNKATGEYSHAEGYSVIVTGERAHGEGESSQANGYASHAEGMSTTADGKSSHSEGYRTTASGDYSHAEGDSTKATGNYSHSEGRLTTASGNLSHSEGIGTVASGSNSHVEGLYTTAQRRSQHVFGEYNVLDTTGSGVINKGSYIEIVGNGTSSSARSNARTLDWSGNEVLAGKLTVGTAPTNNMDVATKQYVDNAVAPEVFVVTFTYSSGDNYTANKTYSEITTAYNAGKIVYGKDSNYSYIYNGSSFMRCSVGLDEDGWFKAYIMYYENGYTWCSDSTSAPSYPTLSLSGNTLQLKQAGADGGVTILSSVSLPVYNGGVS